MRRLFGILFLFGLMTSQGLAAAAAICHHHSAREHVMARESHDRRIAAGALGEESAASVVGKKGSLPGSGASIASPLADLLPAHALGEPRTIGEPVLLHSADPRELVGISTGPMLRPPLA